MLECGGATFQEIEMHYSYWFSIYNMWTYEAYTRLPNGTKVEGTGFYPARPAAGALFGFSFVWPHLKLLFMHIAFYAPLRSNFRRNTNYWLAFWGKWSLADALVMCCVIGLFNLTIDMDMVEAYNYFHKDIDHLCHDECAHLYNASDPFRACNATCSALEGFFERATFNYDSLPSSQVGVTPV